MREASVKSIEVSTCEATLRDCADAFLRAQAARLREVIGKDTPVHVDPTTRDIDLGLATFDQDTIVWVWA